MTHQNLKFSFLSVFPSFWTFFFKIFPLIFYFLIFSILLPSPVKAQKNYYTQSPDLLYNRALDLLEKEKFGSAQEEFDRYISLNLSGQKHVDAKYFSALCGLRLFQPDASGMFENFVHEYPDDPKSQMAYFNLGNYYFQQKDYEKAGSYYNITRPVALNSYQKNEFHFNYGYTLFSQKKLNEAKEHFDKIKKGKHEYSYAANYYAGYINLKQQNYNDALNDLKIAESSSEFALLVPALITSIYYKTSRTGELIDYAEKIVSSNERIKDLNQITLLLADTYFEMQKYSKAIPVFENYLAKKEDSPNPHILYKLGYCYYKEKEYQKSADRFKLINIRNDSLSQLTAYHLGLCYIKLNNKPFALTAFNEAKKYKVYKNITEESHFTAAKLNVENRLYNQAINEFQSFIQQYPKGKFTEESRSILSEVFLDSKDYAQAIAIIEKMPNRNMRVNSAYQKISYYRGLELFNDNNFADAVKMFMRSLENPINKEIGFLSRYYIAECYSSSKKWDEAISKYNLALSQKEFNNHSIYWKSLYGIAYCYFNMKKYDTAESYFEKLITNPDFKSKKEIQLIYFDASVRLADCYFVEKKYSKAAVLYENTIKEKSPYADYAYFQCGMISSINDQLDDAKLNFSKVWTAYPNSKYTDDAYYFSAQVHYEKGFYEEAIKEFTNLINNRKNSRFIPFAFVNRGNSKNNLQQYSQAIPDFVEVIENYSATPAASDAILNLQTALGKLNRSNEFNKYLAMYEKSNPKSNALEEISFKNAKNLYDNEKYSEAITGFQQYQQKFNFGKYKMDALFFSGESYYRMNKFNEALEEYDKVYSLSTNEYTLKTAKRISAIRFQNKDYMGAISSYRTLENLSENRFDLLNARLGIVRSYFEIGLQDSVIKYANSILNYQLATQDAVNEARLYIAKCSYSKNDWDKTIDFLKNILNNSEGEKAAEAAYMIADVQFKQGKNKESLTTLFKLNEDFPGYDHWIGKSFLLIAENYLATKENFQAKATLQSIIDNAQDADLIEKARIKLSELNTLQEKETPISNDTITEKVVEPVIIKDTVKTQNKKVKK